MLGVWDDHDYGMNNGGKVCSRARNLRLVRGHLLLLKIT